MMNSGLINLSVKGYLMKKDNWMLMESAKEL